MVIGNIQREGAKNAKLFGICVPGGVRRRVFLIRRTCFHFEQAVRTAEKMLNSRGKISIMKIRKGGPTGEG